MLQDDKNKLHKSFQKKNVKKKLCDEIEKKKLHGCELFLVLSPQTLTEPETKPSQTPSKRCF